MEDRNTNGTDSGTGNAAGGAGDYGRETGGDPAKKFEAEARGAQGRRDAIAKGIQSASARREMEQSFSRHAPGLAKRYGNAGAGLENIMTHVSALDRDPASMLRYLAARYGLTPQHFENNRSPEDMHRELANAPMLQQVGEIMSRLNISEADLAKLNAQQEKTLYARIGELRKDGRPPEEALAIAWQAVQDESRIAGGQGRTDFRFRGAGNEDSRRDAIRRALRAHGGRPQDIGR